MPKQQATPRRPDKVFRNTVDPASMIRARLIRSSSAISKSNRFPVVLPLLDCNSVISKPHYKSFSTDSPVGPFVGSDDHIVRVVTRKGNAFRQARVHWLLASLVLSSKETPPVAYLGNTHPSSPPVSLPVPIRLKSDVSRAIASYYF